MERIRSNGASKEAFAIKSFDYHWILVGMWHLPIWFTTGYMGMDLMKYILFFMIALISTKIVMTAFYNLNQNLIIPIIIHQLFNFFIGLINGNLLELIMYSAILYSVVAVLLIVINPKTYCMEMKIQILLMESITWFRDIALSDCHKWS